MNEIKEYNEKIFEDIKRIDEENNEFWYARELQDVLGYHQWRSISNLIERAKVACIVMNGNSKKIALAQTYFAIQTRKLVYEK